MVWGPVALYINVPSGLAGFFQVLPGVNYPVYRLLLLGLGILTAAALWWWWHAPGSVP